MRFFCPSCWRDFWNENSDVCPVCHYDIRGHDGKDYVAKLLNALNHPAGDIQHWAMMILGQRREKRAIPYLDKIAKESKDPSLKRAAAEALKRINAGLVWNR